MVVARYQPISLYKFVLLHFGFYQVNIFILGAVIPDSIAIVE